MDCPNGVKYIHWRFDNEEWARMKGDSYRIEQEQGKCPVRYHVFGTYYSKNLSAGGCDTTAFWRTISSAFPSEYTTYQPTVSGTTWRIQRNTGYFSPLLQIPSFRYENNWVGRARNSAALQYLDSDAACQNITKPGYGNQVTFTKVIRQDGLPDNCGGCRLDIIANNVIVYSRTKDTCPEVKEYCETKNCPPDTCECRHGSIICCHDSKTGEVVEKIRL